MDRLLKGFFVKIFPKEVTIRARVYRVNSGQWEDLGIIASNKKSWIIKKKIESFLREVIVWLKNRI